MSKPEDKNTLDEIRTIIDQFDKDFDDPLAALQNVADVLGIDKNIAEDDDDDLWEDDDDEDDED